MNDLVLKAEHVSKQYRYGAIGAKTLSDEVRQLFSREKEKKGTFYAVDDVSFEVGRGEKLAIIGGNGAGKSTLLRMIARITAPTKGDIYIDGRVSSILQIGTGFHNELTGRENIYLNGTILGMSKRAIDKKLDEIIAFSECEEFIDTPVKRYSSGMFVKLAFSVAVNLDNDILIMDEVLAVGDVRFQQKCLTRLGEIASQEGRTILFVSHNMNSVRQLCPRSIVLKKGKLIFDGDTSSAIEHYMNVARDGGESYYSFSSAARSGSFAMPFAIDSASVGRESNGKLPVKVKILPVQDVECAELLFTVCTADGQPVGTIRTGNAFELKSGVPTEIACETDVSLLASGVYSVNFGLTAVVGNRRMPLDKVDGAFIFHSEGRSVELNPSLFGAVAFPDAETSVIYL